MGLLDDAIREHLELKRRHGADPDEVSRQEREALGAPVRGEFAKPAGEQPDEGDEPAAVAASEALAPEPEAEVADVPEFDEPPEMPGEPEPEPAERPAAREPEPRPGDEEDPWLVEDLADPEPEPEPESEPRPEPEPESAAPPAKPGQGDDVLEETPDFLQETPEHDRLWFEQKPPRDFDWDK
jgi:hypothetical protein